ncbi:MAG: hypothetical protein QG633_125 [Patescibacteria group bacterium]|jgi:hypothetical protein|nr:hypothetical protein [Patescibacteria group bacterium]
MTVEERQREYSRERDKEDRRVLLKATLEFLGIDGEDSQVINRRDLPPEVEALVGDIERSLEVPVICKVIGRPTS